MLHSDVDVRCSVGLMNISDPLEDDAGRPQLRVRPAGVASGPERFGQAPRGRPPPRRVLRLRARDAPPPRNALVHPRWRLRRAGPARGRGRCWRSAPCSRTCRPRAAAPRRPLGPARGRRPVSTCASSSGTRRSSVFGATPWTAPVSDSPGHPEWRRPPAPRPLGPSAPGPGRVAGPIRRVERRARPPPRRGCLPAAAGSLQARSAASRALAAGRAAAPHRPGGPPSRPGRRSRAAGGSRRGGRGSGRGGSRWRWFDATAPWPRSIVRPGRTGRVPAGRTQARSRRPRSTADPARRRLWPPLPRREVPAPAGPRRRG